MVEGPSDKEVFLLLLDEFFTRSSLAEHTPIKRNDIDIDTAEQLIGFDTKRGNRDKVEYICAQVEGLPYAEKLVGFVDREFREFELDHVPPQDNLHGHKVSGRLVWSRGHSIENYFFDFRIVHDPFRSSYTKDRSDDALDCLDDALDLFEKTMDATMRLACAVSLAGYDIGIFEPIEKSISWELLDISDAHVTLHLDAWREELINNRRFSKKKADTLLDRFTYWHDRLLEASPSVARWMCHGHIGIKILWAAYARCMVIAWRNKARTKPETGARQIAQSSDESKWRDCIIAWARHALDNLCEYPKEVFMLLGLHGLNGLNKMSEHPQKGVSYAI